jgi:hypothetical protein
LKTSQSGIALGVNAVTVIYTVLFLLLFAVVTRWLIFPPSALKRKPASAESVKPGARKTAA